jgi:hypothetical protein
MTRNKLYQITSTLLLAAVLMAACAPGQSAGPTSAPAGTTLPSISPSSAPSSTPDPSETPEATSTGTTSSSVSVTGVPSNPLPPTGETPSSDHSQVTLADNGASITLHVGQTFLLNLGDQYDWNINVADQTVLSRVKNIAVIRGAQGVYQALKAGTTTLMAGGDPPCRKSSPPCMRPSIAFELSVVVEP